ncbi:MAG: ribonuclease III domain-containing protein [Thermoplasmata archaeon]
MKTEPDEEWINKIKEYLWEKFSIKTGNIDVYDEAFTHSTCGTPNNQRLAFLGDRVFDLLFADDILEKHPDDVVGALDRKRIGIHDKKPQTRMARKIGLIGPMVFGKAYENTPKEELENHETIMSEALEALLGAIYHDQGLEKAREIVQDLVR